MSLTAINVKNQFRGRVTGIIAGPVVSEVEVQTNLGVVTSVITSSSIDALKLTVGDEVLAFVKATDVAIAKI